MKKSFVLAIVLVLLIGCQPQTVIIEKEIEVTEIVEKEVVVKETVVVETIETPESPPAPPEPPPLPNLCDPENPSPESYIPVETLEREPVDNPYLQDGSALRVDYSNEEGQRFRLTVSGREQDTIEEYLDELIICFEAHKTNPPIEEGVRGKPFDEILIDAVMDQTGISRQELSDRRDSYHEGTTLTALLEELGFDVDSVLDQVIEQTTQEIERLVEAGVLTREQADNLLPDLVSSYELRLEAIDIPFLFVPVEQESDYADFLSEDERTLIVDMEWRDLDTTDNEQWVIHYLIDPTINRYQRRDYRAKCKQSASVRLRAWAGRMSVYFYRYDPREYLGRRTADKGGEDYPPGISASSYPNWRTYDVYTRGWENGSKYSLYGNWYEGKGGGCK